MHTANIHYRSSQIHYSYGGSGDRLLLCLHGYGETEESFHFLERYLPANYLLVAVDLPFHGATVWKEGLSFTTEDLLAITDAIAQQHRCRQHGMTLIGFSMGGRMALSLLQRAPERIGKLVLLAPDGLKVNIWYRFATRSLVGKHLFRFTMRHPQWFLRFLQAGNKLGLINQSVFKFTNYYIHDRQVREDLYNRWTCMRCLRPHLPTIKEQVVQYGIAVRLLYGKYDRIIRFERGEKFRRGIESFCTLQVIPTGHQVLQEKNAPVILSLLES